MPEQIIKIIRAPESEPVDPYLLRLWLYETYKNSEWEVIEVKPEQSKKTN